MTVDSEQIHNALAPYSIAAITGGRNAPSRRFRINSLVPYLAKRSVQVRELCPLVKRHPPQSTWLRLPWLIAALVERLTYIARVRSYDAVILQRELISTLPSIEHLIPGKIIFDVDDAIYLHRGGRAAKHAAVSALGVVCGNEYLAEHFLMWNPQVTVIPTGVDTERLIPGSPDEKQGAKIIGWIGTSGNMKYLEPIAKYIRKAVTVVPQAEFHVISDTMVRIPQELRSITHFTQWYPDIECVEVPKWSVGLMPLVDGEWERGKCAFKLLQYLAAGVPAIASPVGMNKKVMDKNNVGYLIDSNKDWEEAIIGILTDDNTANGMGKNGRKLIEEHYSLSVVSYKWREVLDIWLGGS